ncbi:MAG TPA: SRPBCC domain-containing protein [Alteraurantiacibacter sp.]
MRAIGTFIAFVGFAFAAPAAAEVASSGDTGFAVTGSADIAAPSSEVWAALVEPSRYWNGEHSWSGDAGNMTLEPEAGGCFCETIPGGGSAEHMRVVSIMPESRLVMRGSLGPLQGEALTGVLTVTLEPVGEGARLAWAYVVGGYARYPLPDIAPAVDGVIAEQMTRLAGLFD